MQCRVAAGWAGRRFAPSRFLRGKVVLTPGGRGGDFSISTVYVFFCSILPGLKKMSTSQDSGVKGVTVDPVQIDALQSRLLNDATVRQKPAF